MKKIVMCALCITTSITIHGLQRAGVAAVKGAGRRIGGAGAPKPIPKPPPQPPSRGQAPRSGKSQIPSGKPKTGAAGAVSSTETPGGVSERFEGREESVSAQREREKSAAKLSKNIDLLNTLLKNPPENNLIASGNTLVAGLFNNQEVEKAFENTLAQAKENGQKIILISDNATETIEFLLKLAKIDPQEIDSKIFQWQTVQSNNADINLGKFIILSDKSGILFQKTFPDIKNIDSIIIKGISPQPSVLNPITPSLVERISEDLIAKTMTDKTGEKFLKNGINYLEQSIQKAKTATVALKEQLPSFKDLLRKAEDIGIDPRRQKQLQDEITQLESHDILPAHETAGISESFAELKQDVSDAEERKAKELAQKSFGTAVEAKKNLLDEIDKDTILSPAEKEQFKKQLQKRATLSGIENVKEQYKKAQQAKQQQKLQEALAQEDAAKEDVLQAEIDVANKKRDLELIDNEALQKQAALENAQKTVTAQEQNIQELKTLLEQIEAEQKALKKQLPQEQKATFDAHAAEQKAAQAAKLAELQEALAAKKADELATQQAAEKALTEQKAAQEALETAQLEQKKLALVEKQAAQNSAEQQKHLLDLVQAEEQEARKQLREIQKMPTGGGKKPSPEVISPEGKKPAEVIPPQAIPAEKPEPHIEAEQARLAAETKALRDEAQKNLDAAKADVVLGELNAANKKRDLELATQKDTETTAAFNKATDEAAIKSKEKEELEIIKQQTERELTELKQKEQQETAIRKKEDELKTIQEQEAKLEKKFAERTAAERAAKDAADKALAEKTLAQNALEKAQAEQETLTFVEKQTAQNLAEQQRRLHELMREQEQLAREQLREIPKIPIPPIPILIGGGQEEEKAEEQPQPEQAVPQEKEEKPKPPRPSKEKPEIEEPVIAVPIEPITAPTLQPEKEAEKPIPTPPSQFIPSPEQRMIPPTPVYIAPPTGPQYSQPGTTYRPPTPPTPQPSENIPTAPTSYEGYTPAPEAITTTPTTTTEFPTGFRPVERITIAKPPSPAAPKEIPESALAKEEQAKPLTLWERLLQAVQTGLPSRETVQNFLNWVKKNVTGGVEKTPEVTSPTEEVPPAQASEEIPQPTENPTVTFIKNIPTEIGKVVTNAFDYMKKLFGY